MTQYEIETLYKDYDDGQIVDNVKTLAESVVGHRIRNVEINAEVEDAHAYYGKGKATIITLDDGSKVQLVDTNDCCAYTELRAFLLHADKVDHIITGVGTTDGYNTWHIYADMGDVLALTVGWSCGNPFYYGYGFDIKVIPNE